MAITEWIDKAIIKANALERENADLCEQVGRLIADLDKANEKRRAEGCSLDELCNFWVKKAKDLEEQFGAMRFDKDALRANNADLRDRIAALKGLDGIHQVAARENVKWRTLLQRIIDGDYLVRAARPLQNEYKQISRKTYEERVQIATNLRAEIEAALKPADDIPEERKAAIVAEVKDEWTAEEKRLLNEFADSFTDHVDRANSEQEDSTQ